MEIVHTKWNINGYRFLLSHFYWRIVGQLIAEKQLFFAVKLIYEMNNNSDQLLCTIIVWICK